MEEVDKEAGKRKATLQDFLFFVEMFEDNNTDIGHDTNFRKQQENNIRTNPKEQQAPQDVTCDNGKVEQQQQNQYEVGKTDAGAHAAVTGMRYTPSTRELGYLNQTSLLRKHFKIRGVIGNAEQTDS